MEGEKKASWLCDINIEVMLPLLRIQSELHENTSSPSAKKIKNKKSMLNVKETVMPSKAIQ